MDEKAQVVLKLQFDKRLRLDLPKHIMRCPMFRSKWRQYSFLLITSVILILLTLVGCGPSTEDLLAVEYTPLPGDDWKVSTPAEQGFGSDACGGAILQCC